VQDFPCCSPLMVWQSAVSQEPPTPEFHWGKFFRAESGELGDLCE